MDFLNRLTLPRLILGVRSATKPSFPWLIPAPPCSVSPALSGTGSFLWSQVFLISTLRKLRQRLQMYDLIFPFHLAKVHLAIGLGLSRKQEPSGAGAYLHANHCVDEEQHGYEEGDIRKRLEERKHSAQHWPLAPVTAWAQTEDPHEATCFFFPCYIERTSTEKKDFHTLAQHGDFSPEPPNHVHT